MGSYISQPSHGSRRNSRGRLNSALARWLISRWKSGVSLTNSRLCFGSSAWTKMISMSAVPPRMGSVSEDTSEPVRYAALMSRSLKARSCAVSFAIRISDARVTRINNPFPALAAVPGAGSRLRLWQRQALLKRGQVQALPDAALDQFQMFGILKNIQAVR